MRKTLTIALVATLMTSTAMARPSLQSVTVVENGLLTLSVANKIRRECDDIAGRLLKARGMMQDLYNHARKKGYSDDEIKAYMNADAEKSRMRSKRDAYLKAKGVVKSQPETYCAAGRAEIKQSSQIGALLRAK